MANKLEIEINGKTVQLERSLKTVTAAISQAKREANELSKDMKLDPTNADLVVKRHEQLAQALALSTEKAKILKDDLDKIDPDVDPSAYFRLAKQVANAERESRSLTRQLTVSESAVKRLNATAGTFKFNPGDGVKEFGKSLEGIDAAISTLGNTKEIINFDRSKAGFDAVKANFNQLDKLAELLTKRVNVLDSELSTIDVKADPKGFARIVNQINDVKSQLKTIGEAKAEAHAILHDGVTHKARGIIATIRDIAKAPTSVTEKLKALSMAGLDGLVSTLKQAPKAILGNLGSLAKTGVQAIGKTAVDSAAQMGGLVVKALSSVWGTVGRVGVEGIKAAGSMTKNAITGAFGVVGGLITRTIVGGMSGIGHAITSAITAPFRGISHGISTIIRGSLLTVGQNITNTVSGTVKGAVNSMEEAQKSAKSLKNVLDFADVDSGTIDKLTKDMADYAKTTTYGASELNKVVAGLSSSNVEANKAGDLTKNIANAYSLLGDGSRKLSDIGVIFSQINSATKLTAQDFNQLRDAGLGGAIKRDIERNYPDIIKQFGNFSKAMSEGAISAEMVNQAVSRIGQSDAARKAATVPKTMGEAFDTLQETIGQKFQVVYSKLTSGGIGFISRLTDKIDNMDFSPITKGVESAFARVGNVGNIIKDALKGIDFKSVLDGVVKVFDILGAKVKLLFDVIKSIGQHINFADVFKGALDIIKQISDAITTVGKGLVNMVGNIDWSKALQGASHVLNSIVGAVKAIATTLGQALSSDAMTTTLGAVGNMIKTIVDSIASVAKSPIFKQVIDGIVSLIGSASNLITGLVRSISGALSDSKVGDTISRIVDGVKSIGEHISDLVSTPAFGAFVKGTFGTLSTILGGIVALVRDITGALTDMGKDNNVAKGIGGAFDTINNIISKTFGLVRDVGKTIGEAFADSSMGDALSRFGDVIGGVLDKLSEFAKSDTAKSIASAFADLSTSALDIVSSLGSTFSDLFSNETVTSGIQSIMDSVTTIGRTIATWFDSDAFKSTVTAVAEIVSQLGATIADVFDKALSIVTQFLQGADLSAWGDAIGKVIDVAKSFVDKALEPIQDSLDYLRDTGILDWMWGAFNDLAKAFGRLMEVIKPVTDFLGWLTGKVLGLAIEGAIEVIGGLAKAIGSLVGWLADMVDAIGKLGADIFAWVKDTFFGSADGGDHASASSYASYSNYASASTINNNTANSVNIHVNPAPGMDVTTLARQVRREVELGLA